MHDQKRVFLVTFLVLLLGFFSFGLSPTGYLSYSQPSYFKDDNDCSFYKLARSNFGHDSPRYIAALAGDPNVVDTKDITLIRESLYAQGMYCDLQNEGVCYYEGQTYCGDAGHLIKCIYDPLFGSLIKEYQEQPYKAYCADGEWRNSFIG